MTTLSIDIISDIACPWCAIGYARLSEALQSTDLTADISWRAFELNPDSQATREPIADALAKKYQMDASQVEQTQQQMIDAANELGLNFEKMASRYTCNTFDAHRLVKWAAQFDKQTELKLALFEAYLGRAESVDEQAVLLACVGEVGLDRDKAQHVLESDEYKQAVQDEEKVWQQAGITSVPSFVINQKYLISGAQEPSAMADALTEIAQKDV
ncbi:DsbA family oxidoreductase [Salinimonas chungwhensis]|uniref:DsbA family oxidoreductase n=1 Tax=Salinimonas chungwhensis TaxID=265425 RepID=UPI00035F7812|nr:DsbA family oxidoreductase [Salinimonas chungwhensis]